MTRRRPFPLLELVRAALFLCAWLCCTSPQLHAQESSSLPVDGGEIEGLKLARIWRFDVEGDKEGWFGFQGIAPLEVHDGALWIRNIDRDPQLLGPLLSTEASQYQFLALRCRSSAPGETQVYFSKTDPAGFREEQMLPLPMKGDGQWHTYTLDLRPLRDWSGTLQRLRIDPVNGPAEIGARVEIDWIALGTASTWISPLLPWWKDGQTLVLGFENRGGQQADGPIDLRCNGKDIAQLPCIEDSGRVETEIDARGQPAHFWIEAWLAGERIWRGRMVKPVAPASVAPTTEASLALGTGVGELARGANMRVHLGPIASLTLRGPGKCLSYYEFDVAADADASGAADATRLYRECLDDPALAEILCTTSVQGTTVRTTIETSAPVSVLRFEGPRLLELRPHSHALFPGLEYLDAGEESAQSISTGAVAADRTTPAPWKITAPLMAFEYDRDAGAQHAWVAALLWDIDNRLKLSPGVPAAEFCSRKQGPSYATTFLPSISTHVDENTRYAARPYPLPALERLESITRFLIAPGTLEEVFAEHWAEALPRPPGLDWAAADERVPEPERAGPGSHAALEHILATSMSAYTKTLFSAAAQGWKTHIAIGEPYRERPELAATILCESLRSAHPEYAASVGLPVAGQIEDLIGSAAVFVRPGARKLALSVLGRLREDGSIAYRTSAESEQTIEEFTAKFGSQREDLGEVGTTDSGLIAATILPLLEYAACTRDPLFVAAGERALAKLNSYTVPRGAQTWEIHMHTPDLYASAECTLANLWGWRIRGDPAYLEAAVRWAKTGLPFLYCWEPPDGRRVESVDVFNGEGEGRVQELRDAGLFYADTRRQVAPYASIPVFGTSWYAVTWLGTPVQWCGLAWANAIRELDALRRLPSLVRVADGVFRSAANQQCDQGYLAGTMPDSWEIATARSRQPYIIPERILEYAYRVLDVPRADALQYERLEGTRWTHVASRALLGRVEVSGTQLGFDARFVHGQDASILVGGTGGAPAHVRVNGREIGAGDGPWQARWLAWEGARGALFVRWRATGDRDRIELVD